MEIKAIQVCPGSRRTSCKRSLDSVHQGMQTRARREGAWKGEGPEEETETEEYRGAPAFAGPALARPAFAILGPAGSGKTTPFTKPFEKP